MSQRLIKVLAVLALISAYVLFFVSVIVGDTKGAVRGNPSLALNLESVGGVFLYLALIFSGLLLVLRHGAHWGVRVLIWILATIGCFICFWFGGLVIGSVAQWFV